MTAASTTAIRVLDPRPRSAPSIIALDHRRVE
jgi:hypothetical protein